jgi:integrase
MSVKRIKAASGERCAPKEGEIICVESRRLDRSQAHRHFGKNEMSKAKLFERQSQAEAHAPGKAPAPSTDTFEAYGELWRAAQRPADPNAVLYPLKRAYAGTLVDDKGKPLVDGKGKPLGPFGEMVLVDINKLRLQCLQNGLLNGYARASVEVTMHYVKTVMRHAFDEQRIPTDPTIRLKMPRRDTLDTAGIVTAEEVPTHAEALAILAGAPAPFRFAVALGIGCGLRVGEVLGVTPAQIDLAAGTLRVDAQEPRRGRVGPKTWRGVRTIELPDVVKLALRQALRDDPPDNVPLMTGPRGGRPRNDEFYSHVWRPALKAAGLDAKRFKFHAARHYCVSAMLARGVPITEVAAYVGDAVETISSTYAHWLRDSDPMAKGALDAALGPVPPKPKDESEGEATGDGTTK